MAFEPIETQEQLDEVIKGRLEREREKYKDYLSPEAVKEKYEGFMSAEDAAKKYEGYISPEDAKKKDDKIAAYERASVKTKVAKEYNIPESLVSRLVGETEEELKKDAEQLAADLKLTKKAPPRVDHEGSDEDGDRAELKKMLKGLKGE